MFLPQQYFTTSQTEFKSHSQSVSPSNLQKMNFNLQTRTYWLFKFLTNSELTNVFVWHKNKCIFALVINFLLEAGAFRFYMKGNLLISSSLMSSHYLDLGLIRQHSIASRKSSRPEKVSLYYHSFAFSLYI